MNNIEWLTKTPITHRGLHDGYYIPENSLLAFNEAVKKSYSIELDVRITKDNQIVVFHDKNLSRLSNVKKKIRNMNFSELNELRLYGTEEKIPLLREVLDLVDCRVPILIDIKDYGDMGVFEEQIYEAIKDYKGEFAICSFNPRVVSWFRKNQPKIKRGFIFGDLEKVEIKYYNFIFLYRYLTIRPNFISIDYKLINSFIINLCKFFKIPLITWTIKTKDDATEVLNKVDNIIFENFDPKSLAGYKDKF